LLPLIAIPTTAGTGSEVQSYALIRQSGSGRKMACGDPALLPAVAILDVEVTATVPADVAGKVGLDALAHAVETSVTRIRTPFSALFSREAFRLVSDHLPAALEGGGTPAAREAMQRAATFAGIAIEQSMLGAAHALANPLTARHGVPHGQAVGMVLPHVVRFNAADPEIAGIYAELARCAGLCAEGADRPSAVRALVDRLHSLRECAGLPRSLAACGIPVTEADALAGLAAEEWTGSFNPRPVGAAEFRRLYEEAIDGQD
jgi:alcohol dehydrogenase